MTAFKVVGLCVVMSVRSSLALALTPGRAASAHPAAPHRAENGLCSAFLRSALSSTPNKRAPAPAHGRG